MQKVLDNGIAFRHYRTMTTTEVNQMAKTKKAKLLELVEYLDTCAWMLERAYTHENTVSPMTVEQRANLWNRQRSETLKEIKQLIG